MRISNASVGILASMATLDTGHAHTRAHPSGLTSHAVSGKIRRGGKGRARVTKLRGGLGRAAMSHWCFRASYCAISLELDTG
jgi:hypothetical protein